MKYPESRTFSKASIKSFFKGPFCAGTSSKGTDCTISINATALGQFFRNRTKTTR